MPNVVAKITGGNPQNVTAATVGELKEKLGVKQYQAARNGSPAQDSEHLSDDDFITLSPAVKGGSR